jgi:hypothetical protein
MHRVAAACPAVSRRDAATHSGGHGGRRLAIAALRGAVAEAGRLKGNSGPGAMKKEQGGGSPCALLVAGRSRGGDGGVAFGGSRLREAWRARVWHREERGGSGGGGGGAG